MNLAKLLPMEAMLPHLEARDKKHTLKLLAERASSLIEIPEQEIYAALLEREQIGCTGMGNGVCVPHGRFDELKTSHVVFARLDHAIEFGAADGKKVDLICLLLTPTAANTEHLKALALVSRLLRDKELCNNLRSTRDAAVMHDLLLLAASRLENNNAA